MRRGRALAAALLALSTLPVAARADVPGTIAFAGCVRDAASIQQGDGCTSARALANTAFLAISPDGRNVYATSRDAAAVTVFARGSRTGALVQLPATAGCVSDGGSGGCASGHGLARAWGIAVSPDGRNVYVAARNADAVTTFTRSTMNGALAETGCVVDDAATAIDGCTTTPGLDGATDVTISADGAEVYVAALDGDAVATFTRDPTTGALSPAGCLRETTDAAAGCTPAKGLGGARSLSLSPDGANLYVAATTDSLSALTTLARSTSTGALTFVGCLSGDATDHYDSDCTQIAALSFDQFVKVSPDGHQVYATATNTSSILTLRRQQDGSLVQDEVPASCVADIDIGTESCAGVFGIAQPLGLAFAAGGQQVFSAEFGSGTVLGWQRDPVSGLISQLGPCLSSGGGDCEGHGSLERAGYLAIAPDERYLYVNAPTSSAVTVVARAYAPAPLVLPSGGVRFRGGVAQVTVGCPTSAGTVGCMGTLRVVQTRRIPVPKAVTVARAGFDLAAGASATVSLPLDKAAVKRAHIGRRFAGVLAAAANDATGDHVATSQRKTTITR
jgi:DNA-binding beta-propeller fold protein YncE